MIDLDKVRSNFPSLSLKDENKKYPILLDQSNVTNMKDLPIEFN